MQKAHDASKNDFWHNRPDTSSPITETELNRIETSIDTIDDRVVTFDTTKANQSDILQAVKSINYTASTGTFRITFFNNNFVDINTDIEKVAINFDYDDDPESAHYQQLVIELDDGTYKYVNLSSLITQFEFLSTTTIQAIVSQDGKVSFNIVNGSITENKLQPNFLADCRAAKNAAETAETSAIESKEDSEAWAIGKRNGIDVPNTDETYHNNAKYYSDNARAITGNKVDTWNGRDGQVVPEYGDYSIEQINPDSIYNRQMPGDIITVAQDGKFLVTNRQNEVYYCEVDDGYYDYNIPIAGTYLYKYTVNITSYREANEFLNTKLILIKFKKGNQNPFVSIVFHIDYTATTPIGHNEIYMDQEIERRINGSTIIANSATCPNFVKNDTALFCLNYLSELELVSNKRNATELWITAGLQSVGTQVIRIEHPAIAGTIDSQVFEVFSLSSTGKSASISSIVPSSRVLVITLSSPLTEQMNFFIKITNMIGS